MDVSLKWLGKLVDIKGLSVQELADKITVGGVEVEDIKYLAQGSNLVVGKVIECVAHPDSDHLHVCQVDEGDGIHQIVCGAPNVAKGQKVIVSRPGAVLPAKGITIQKGNIRGVESNGMICSLLELGVDKKYLSEEQCNGIEVLGDDAIVGDENPLGYLGLDDVIFELKPTPNRGDVLSLISFAYEVAAVLDRKVNADIFEDIKFDKLEKSEYTVNSATEKCSYFSIKGVKDVKIKESPKWLKEALQGCSVRSINNVVDIGNYVMLLTGQPLHMYDADKIANKDFVVKDDYEGNFTALDNQNYELHANDLVVTNNNEVSCLAGVMGGLSTSVTEETKNIAIEAATFHSTNVRRTSIRLNLISDSSTRFVRGIDSTRSDYALDLAAKLLVELADAKVVEETVRFGDCKDHRKPIELTQNRVNSLLGTEFSKEEIKDVLVRFNFEVEEKDDYFVVTAPSYRKDIFDTEDLIEEVIRLKGFDHLHTTYPVTSNIGGYNKEQKQRKQIRDYLLGLGINEALTYSLVHNKYAEDFCCLPNAKKEKVDVLHPLTEEHGVVRKSVVPSLLLAANYNYYRGTDSCKFFEISKVHTQEKECEVLGIILSGVEDNSVWKQTKNEQYNFYHMKGIVEGLLAKFGIDEKRYQLARVEETNPYYHLGCSAYIKTGPVVWGVIGEIHPNMQKKYDVNKTIACEIDLDYLYAIKTSPIKFVEPSVYPSITRDIALVCKKEIDSSSLIRTIKKQGKGLVTDCFVFDVYEGEHVEAGYKSVALRIVYHDDKQTLKDTDITPVHENILLALEKEYLATLRK